ncbi:hypothetical protein KCU88_g5106, partial [Aureobasidium melanogenum]
MPPTLGSEPQRQPVHSDADFAHPGHPFALVVNVPLIDMKPENESTEVWLGTHQDYGLEAQEGAHGERNSGRIRQSLLEERSKTSAPSQPFTPKGSIIVRDLRLWHAGMPNYTDDVRIMPAMIHFAPWYRNQMKVELAEELKPLVEDHPELDVRANYDEEIAQCFEHYLEVLSPWYDLNDQDSTFGARVAEQAQHNPLLMSAVVAFAAMHKARTGHSSFMLIADRYDSATKDGTALAATCLLRSYEILAEEEDPNRHLFGAFSLIPALTFEFPSEPVLRAGLWNYMHLGNVDINPSRDDDYPNQASLLLARIIDAVFLHQHAVVEQLREALESWKSSLPFRPYHQSDGVVFPKILAAMHYYHVATMVLNQSEADPVELESHARAICGLAFSASSNAVMVNAYGPISYSMFPEKYGGDETNQKSGAGWLRRGDDRCEVVSRLLDSQKRTGWLVQAIIKKLKECWTGTDNLKAGHFANDS